MIKVSDYLIIGLILAGCVAPPDRAEFDMITGAYRPNDAKPPLPVLQENSPLADYFTYALLNNPRVEATFYEWKSAVEEVTASGSLPQPKLTLGAELQSGVKAFLYGLVAEIPWPGKLTRQAEAQSAMAQAKRYMFEVALLETALKIKQTYYEAVLLEERILFTKEDLLLLEIEVTSIQTNLKTGLAGVNDLAMVQMEQERTRTELTNMEDSRKPLMARWRAALGIAPDKPNPPIPSGSFAESTLPLEADLLEEALAHNVRLKAFSAEVRQAEAMVGLAYQENYPDMMIGAKTDTKKDPFWWMPELSLTLPVWRKKISAQIAAAQAREKQVWAMLSFEEIDLVVLLAEKSFMWRELNRQVRLLKEQLIPRIQIRIESLKAGFNAGRVSLADWLNAQRELLGLKIQYHTAVAQREILFADVSAMVLSRWPEETIRLFK